jgi:hypothetical protein
VLCRWILFSTAALFLLLPRSCFAAEARHDARLTELIHEVSLLPPDAPARRAVANESVPETSAVKTGGDSRAELTFVDQTITRLGSNTLYHFKNAGRRDALDTGSTLLRVPKDSGGATLRTTAVTVAITGTTIILESTRNGTARLTVLEGTARLALTNAGGQTRVLSAGQSVEVPAGAVRIPEPKAIDLGALMKTSPMIVGFRRLPSQNLINNAIRQQQQQRGPANPNSPNRPPGPQNAPQPPGPGPH